MTKIAIVIVLTCLGIGLGLFIGAITQSPKPYVVEVTYITGGLDTFQVTSVKAPELTGNACLRAPRIGHIACGVKKFRVINKVLN